MRVRAVEDELRIPDRRKLGGDVVLVGGGEKLGIGDDALALARARRNGVLDEQVAAVGIDHRRQTSDVNHPEEFRGAGATEENQRHQG